MLGIIDSGIGAKAVASEYSLDNYLILMDRAYFPYGKKSKIFLLCRSIYLCEYLFDYCDEILLACNTLSIMVLPFLKLKYKNKIIGILEYLLPYSNNKSVFLGTTNTINYLNMSYYHYPCLACDELIKSIENNQNIDYELNKIERVIPKDNILLLGCTHFIAIKDRFKHEIMLPKYK